MFSVGLIAHKNSFMNIFLSTWILLVGGLVCALPMLYLRVKDHTTAEEETVYVFLHFT